MLGVAPAPPAAGAFLAFEGGSGDRTAFDDLAIDVFNVGGAFAAPLGQPVIHFLAALGPLHAPAHQWIGFDRQKGGFVRPIFEDLALTRHGGVVEQGERVGAKPRIERHIMGTHHRADGIDLQQTGPGKNAGQMAAIRRAAGARIGKPLCGKRDASGHGERDFFLHADGILLAFDQRWER